MTPQQPTSNYMRRPTPSLRFVLREDGPQYGAKIPMDTPELIYDFYKSTISTDENFELNKEHVVVLLLDTRMQLMGYNIVSVGTVDSATAHPREVFRSVIAAGATGFVLLHNHPSGDPSPSRADENITRKLVQGAEVLSIKLLDHVICGTPSPGRMSYYSFRSGGLIP